VSEPAGSALVEARVSVPDAETARSMASDLVSRQVGACVQILGPVTSYYSWKGEVHQAHEWLLLVKTTAESFEQLTRVVRAHHRYDVPEIVAVPITQALGSYAGWVRSHSGGVHDPERTG
jgi:periplasmic divalent cation tolerance protein